MVAVAGGKAFTFAYAELAECLEAAGAQVAVVDPLHDEALPEQTAALVLPGGFPEVYAAELSANQPLLSAIRAHLTGPRQVTYAECAGLLLLCRQLDGLPMVGHFDADAQMTSQLTLGYRDATTDSDNLVGPAGTTVTGHEFHRTVVTPGAGLRPAWRRSDGSLEGFTTGHSVLASYLHVHPAAAPSLVARVMAGATSPLAGVS